MRLHGCFFGIMDTQKIKLFLNDVPYRAIWELVWPQTATMLCMIVISLTDIYVGGKINSEVQASIGISAQLHALFMVLGTSIGAGAMAAVSQSMGAKRFARAKRYSGFVLVYAFCMAVLLAVIGYCFRYFIMEILQVEHRMVETAVTFFTFVLFTLPFQYTHYLRSVLFRATKEVIKPLLIIIVIAFFNIFGDFAFGLGYFGFTAWGGKGIAFSTWLSYALGAVIALIALYRNDIFEKYVIPRFRWMKKATPYLFKVSIPALTMQFLWQLGYLILFAIVAALPDSVSALAGLTAGMRIESILFMPAVAFNATASILIGSTLGAGKKEEAKKIGLAIIFFGTILMSTIGLCMLPFVDTLAGFFSSDADAQWNIRMYVYINIVSTPFTVGGLIVNGIMVGAGATVYALFINPLCIWGIRLPLGIFLAHILGYGSIGVYFAMLLSMSIQATSMFMIFLKANWTRHTLRKI